MLLYYTVKLKKGYTVFAECVFIYISTTTKPFVALHINAIDSTTFTFHNHFLSVVLIVPLPRLKKVGVNFLVK